MAQSNLYSIGSGVAEDVDVVDRDSRSLGQVDVSQFPSEAEFDMVDDSTRQLGNTSVVNTVDAEVHNEVATVLQAALTANATDELRITSPNPLDVSATTVPTSFTEPVSVENTAGDAIDPAKSDAQGNWPSGHDSTFTPEDETVHTLPSGEVPDGVEVAVMADRGNADEIYIGLTDDPSIALDPGQGFGAQVSNRAIVRVQAATQGDSVNISHEAE